MKAKTRRLRGGRMIIQSESASKIGSHPVVVDVMRYIGWLGRMGPAPGTSTRIMDRLTQARTQGVDHKTREAIFAYLIEEVRALEGGMRNVDAVEMRSCILPEDFS
mgnify:CR=1 FL=1